MFSYLKNVDSQFYEQEREDWAEFEFHYFSFRCLLILLFCTTTQKNAYFDLNSSLRHNQEYENIGKSFLCEPGARRGASREYKSNDYNFSEISWTS